MASPSAGNSLAEGPSLSASALVWGVWALMSLAAFRFAWRYGSEVPFWEEWLYVPCVLGAEPFSLSWLWEQYLEHRYPLHKLICYLSFTTFGLDERPILILDVGLFSLLAATMIWAVRKVRGRPSYADAFFPMALLNLGHAESFYFAATNTYVLSSFLAGMMLVLLYVNGAWFRPREAALAGLILVLLPLCHGLGLVYSACLSTGLMALAARQMRSADPGDRRAGRILLSLAAVALFIIALYFVGFQKSRFAMPDGDIRIGPATVARMTLRFLTAAFGWGGSDPFGRYMRWAMVAMLTAAIGCLVAATLRRRSEDWLPPLGLALVLGSCLVAALAVGYGRAPWGPASVVASRYAAAAIPTLLCLYFVWEACGPATVRPLGRSALCALVFAFLTVNWMKGRELGQEHSRLQDAFRADVHAGKSIPYLASRHAYGTYYIQERLGEFLRMLRDRRYGMFANLPPDPPMREVPLTSPPDSITGAVWDGRQGRSTSNDPAITFVLPRPTWIAGIRMKFSSENPGGWNPLLKITWRKLDEDRGKEWGGYERLLLPAGVTEVITCWVYDTVDRIKIRPDIRPCDFTLSEIVLLITDPPADQSEDHASPEGLSSGRGDSPPPSRGRTSATASDAQRSISVGRTGY